MIETENMSEQGVENSLLLKSKVNDNCKVISEILVQAAKKMDQLY